MVEFAACKMPLSGKLTATQILKQLPESDSTARDEKVLELFQEGHVPDFYQTWCEVPVKGKELSGVIYSLPDFLCLGTDDDFVRARVNPPVAEKIGKMIGGQLPTSKMVDDIYAASQKMFAEPWGPPYNNSMLRTERWPVQDAKIAETFKKKGFEQGKLTAGHLKNIVVGLGLDHVFDRKQWKWVPKPEDEHGKIVGIYGWYRPNGIPLQGPNPNWKSHPIPYADYSHGTRYVHKTMLLEGKPVSVDEVLRDEARCDVLSREGPLTLTHYPY